MPSTEICGEMEEERRGEERREGANLLPVVCALSAKLWHIFSREKLPITARLLAQKTANYGEVIGANWWLNRNKMRKKIQFFEGHILVCQKQCNGDGRSVFFDVN